MSVTRCVDVFYETGRPDCVDEDRARHVFETAFGVLGRNAGQIAMNSLTGIQLPLGYEQPVEYGSLYLGESPHVALLTSRQVVNRAVRGEPTTTALGFGGFRICDNIVKSKILVCQQDPSRDTAGIKAITTAVHEGGHSFGLQHCFDRTCTMYEYANGTSIRRAAMPTVDKPFCESCADTLQNAAVAFSALESAARIRC